MPEDLTTDRADALIDLAARLFAVAHASMQGMGFSVPLIITGMATQAQESGVSKEDFDTIVKKAGAHATAFEQAAIDAGVIS